MNTPVIQVDTVSKSFAMYNNPAQILREFLWRKVYHDVFWALRNVTLTVNEGDRVGIIGPNGAGKSTLLKLIAGCLTPTSGTITIHGSISSMLSLNSFLNDQETGLENIRFNLQMMGVPQRDIIGMTEEIIDFTELGSFIHAPVKTYSSGMNARLAFALTTALTPDILIVDEVLGVGDGYFVGKAMARMIELCRRGRALLYVSHGLSSVEMLCNRAIWIDKGGIRMDGLTRDVLKAYEEDYRRQEDQVTRSGNSEHAHQTFFLSTIDDMRDSSEYWCLRIRPDTGKVFRDIHYVSMIDVRVAEIQMSASLELGNSTDIRLDILGTEWGRYYEHRGRPCRVLSATADKRKGGHLSVRKPRDIVDGTPVTVELTTQSAANLEYLIIEILDEKTGDWLACASREVSCDQEGWRTIEARGYLPVADEEVRLRVAQKIARTLQPDVVIESAEMIVNDEPCLQVGENKPFQIKVQALVLRPVLALDIGIRIIRNDGVYVFWQSSGQSSGNIQVDSGRVEIIFHFDCNFLAGGQYNLSVYAANGWDVENNYPYSEVFSRKVSVINFSVMREFAMIDFGALNCKVRTTVAVTKEA
ncbi:MAG: ABC transporter ATP-binding protein [Rhodospirillaceae bacterium]